MPYKANQSLKRRPAVRRVPCHCKSCLFLPHFALASVKVAIWKKKMILQQVRKQKCCKGRKVKFY